MTMTIKANICLDDEGYLIAYLSAENRYRLVNFLQLDRQYPVHKAGGVLRYVRNVIHYWNFTEQQKKIGWFHLFSQKPLEEIGVFMCGLPVENAEQIDEMLLHRAPFFSSLGFKLERTNKEGDLYARSPYGGWGFCLEESLEDTTRNLAYAAMTLVD